MTQSYVQAIFSRSFAVLVDAFTASTAIWLLCITLGGGRARDFRLCRVVCRLVSLCRMLTRGFSLLTALVFAAALARALTAVRQVIVVLVLHVVVLVLIEEFVGIDALNSEQILQLVVLIAQRPSRGWKARIKRESQQETSHHLTISRAAVARVHVSKFLFQIDL
jgi:hypothetical protein